MSKLSCSDFKFWTRPYFIALFAIVLVVAVPIVLIYKYTERFDAFTHGELIGGAFVVLAISISAWQIIQHVIHYNKPFLQRHILRILWMVPIFALTSWLGLTFPTAEIYTSALRECYAAYVIYNFIMLLSNFIHSEPELPEDSKFQVFHKFPMCCLSPWKIRMQKFILVCKHGVLQYTVVRPLTSIIILICELNDVYKDGEFKANAAFPYMMAVNFLSQFLAMYCLILFYRVNQEELKPLKPIGKFLCIKLVVFFSFFQGIIISILVRTGVIPSLFNIDDEDSIKLLSLRLKSFLLCVEMFLAAIGHHYTFTYKAYVREDVTPQALGYKNAFSLIFDVSDFRKDLKEFSGVIGTSVKPNRKALPSVQKILSEHAGA